MKDYLKEFEQAMDAIVSPVLNDARDDFDDIDGHEDDDDADTGFTREAIFVQLGRVIDSVGNPNPVTSVTTDDGDHIDVTPMQAKVLRMVATADQIKPNIRQNFLKDIQTTKGLEEFLSVEPKTIPQLFMKKYLGR